MPRPRHTEEQIIAVLREADSGVMNLLITGRRPAGRG